MAQIFREGSLTPSPARRALGGSCTCTVYCTQESYSTEYRYTFYSVIYSVQVLYVPVRDRYRWSRSVRWSVGSYHRYRYRWSRTGTTHTTPVPVGTVLYYLRSGKDYQSRVLYHIGRTPALCDTLLSVERVPVGLWIQHHVRGKIRDSRRATDRPTVP